MHTCTICNETKSLDNFYIMRGKYPQSYCKPCLKAQKKQYYAGNREQKLLEHARARARKFNLDCDITIADVVIPTHCPYLGIELTDHVGKGRTGTNPSLDRIDTSKGYIKGNVQVISDKANRMKSDASNEELIAFATYILRK